MQHIIIALSLTLSIVIFQLLPDNAFVNFYYKTLQQTELFTKLTLVINLLSFL